MLNIKLLHARLGDGSMHTSKSWSWGQEKRPSIMRTDPLAALGCFDQLGPGIPACY